MSRSASLASMALASLLATTTAHAQGAPPPGTSWNPAPVPAPSPAPAPPPSTAAPSWNPQPVPSPPPPPQWTPTGTPTSTWPPTGTPAPYPYPTATPAPAPPPRPPPTWVHVDADSPSVVLEHRDPNGRWVTVCHAPCDMVIASDEQYRINGDGIRPSRVFQVEPLQGGRTTLTVDPANTSIFVLGIVVTSLGPIFMIGGLFVLLISAVDASVGESNGDGSTVGLLMLLGGVAATAGGIVMLVTNAHTSVNQEPFFPRAVRRPQEDAWLRGPTWHEDPFAVATPRAVTAPIFQVHF